MIRVFFNDGKNLKIEVIKEFFEDIEDKDNIVWVDLLKATEKEIEWASKIFNVRIPTKSEVEEIEISSRYWEDNEIIKINTYFLVEEEGEPFNENVSFIIKNNILITIRYRDLLTFNEVIKKITTNLQLYTNGFKILSAIMSIRIDKDADILEFITKEINKLSKFAFTGIDITEEILETISYYEEYNMTIRENLIDKQRILSSILKSYRFPPDIKEEFKIMIKDVSSLIDYTTFNFEKLSYLQNIFLGLINLEQNKIVKTLTTLSLLFLPSTLIASIYGMNFKYMPGLEWKFGFVMAIMLMLFITGITYLFIRQKGS